MSAADDTGLVVRVDTHLDTHTAAICDARGRAGSQLQVPSTAEGYAQLLEWARDAAAGRPVAWAIEGTRHLANHRGMRNHLHHDRHSCQAGTAGSFRPQSGR